MQNEHPEYEYAGFWCRMGACIVDCIIFFLVSLPVLLMFYGADSGKDHEKYIFCTEKSARIVQKISNKVLRETVF
ncbi:hypothetical protein MOQ95_004427 [Salmonella enterica]|nr:hypothetical protein [Salmonella enterica]